MKAILYKEISCTLLKERQHSLLLFTSVILVRVKGKWGFINSDIRTNYKIGMGFPTSIFEWVIGVIWNLVVLLTGLTLIMSASELLAVEKVLRYSFLPIIYGIFLLCFVFIFKIAEQAIPEIIKKWCNI